MGLGRLVLKLLTKSPLWNGRIAALGIAAYKFRQLVTDGKDHTFSDYAKVTIPAVSVFIAAYLGTAVLHAFTKEKDTCERTRLGDRKIIKNLEARLQEQTPPSIFLTGEKQLDYGITDTLFLMYKKGTDIEKKAREKQNPALAIDAMLNYCIEGKIDDGYLLLKDAFDWLKNKKPKLSLSGRIAYAYRDLMFGLARRLMPRSSYEYILASVHESILKPEHSWYWSALGRLAADEFKLPQRAEMYVFHALLATAQKRDDTEQAWKEAYNVLCEQPVWERMGESRSIVRKLTNNKFFSSTLVFKERESREELVLEAERSAKLAAIIEDIEVPQPLYITRELHERRYVHIMRHIEGETLYEKLKKDDKDAMPSVITALAKIHVYYPKEGLKKLDVKKNLEEKLKAEEFNIPEELSRTIIQNYTPVVEALNDIPWVWNKDAHPENWIVGKKIGVIDSEGGHLVPAVFDLVNLLEYGDFFDEVEKKAYTIRYIVETHKHDKNINFSTIERAYNNAVIHRVIALASAWSSPKRPRMKVYRKQMIRKAMYAIDTIREKDKQYYERFKDEYLHLHKALQEMHKLIPS